MAQERKKRRIVLASILKPVDDTRMFEKMGMSLATKDEYEVFIVGFPAFSAPSFPGIQFFPLQTFPRLSFQRWLAKWRVFQGVWRLQPSILIFNTHELIWPAIILKICLNVQIVYDVRENYYRNILHTDSFPWFIRIPLALLVRWKEKLTAPIIDHYFLAEKGYENEFKFHRGGWTVIENKTTSSSDSITPREFNDGPIRLIFTGTLSESTGIFRAIEVAKMLSSEDEGITLTIAGYAALKSEAKQIRAETDGCEDFITLIGIEELIPHEQILNAIRNADIGILAYPYSTHTRNSYPTKLYEYLGQGLPILVEDYWPWISGYKYCEPFLLFDFNNSDYLALLKEMRSKKFYTAVPQNISWASEEPKLLAALSKL